MPSARALLGQAPWLDKKSLGIRRPARSRAPDAIESRTMESTRSNCRRVMSGPSATSSTAFPIFAWLFGSVDPSPWEQVFCEPGLDSANSLYQFWPETRPDGSADKVSTRWPEPQGQKRNCPEESLTYTVGAGDEHALTLCDLDVLAPSAAWRSL